MKTTVAIMYDFDNTLSTTDMAEYDFIPDLKMSNKDFWVETDGYVKEHAMDSILGYMYATIKKCKEHKIPLTRDYLKKCGKNILFNKGIDTWFERINSYGKALGLDVKHYVISCGLKPMIEGCAIYDKFANVFASDFVYDENKNAIWPSISINYTNKLQYLFRINKGIEDVSEHKQLNSFMAEEDRPVPFENMIFVGDGLTDVPIMKITRQLGGQSIGVYFNETQSHYLVDADRVDFFVQNDYSQGSKMEIAVQTILNKISARIALQRAKNTL